MRIRTYLVTLTIFLPCILQAQSWQAITNNSFNAVTCLSGDYIALVRFPGDILLSTDSGLTWHEVYHSRETIDTIYQGSDGSVVAVLDSVTELVSNDTGRTWETENGEWKVERARLTLPASLYPLPTGTHSVTFANSLYYAVGEPGLICVSDRNYTHWKELHRAPFSSGEIVATSGKDTQSTGPQGIHSIEFFSPSDGLITRYNELYFTHDSAITWCRTILPDTATASLMISDDAALVATHPKPHDTSAIVLSLVKSGSVSKLQPQISIYRPILQLGWTNKLYSNIYLLTDSAIYFLDTSLSSITISALPLRAGEHAVCASFPDPYTGYILADSITRRDTTLEIDNAWRDTTLSFDTCTIYRSTDGGASWYPTLQNAAGLRKLFFTNAKHGFACGNDGIVMRTDDSASHWARWGVRQNMNEIRFINDSVGYVVGDSGAVYFTQSGGRWWRPTYPVPQFMHPASCYSSIAFSDANTVYILSNDGCYRQHIPEPVQWRFHWRRTQKAPISITASPNPSTGAMHFDVKLLQGISDGSENPSIKIVDFAGRVVFNTIECAGSAPNEWSANADLSYLTTGVYVAVASLGSTTAKCNFVIAH